MNQNFKIYFRVQITQMQTNAHTCVRVHTTPTPTHTQWPMNPLRSFWVELRCLNRALLSSPPSPYSVSSATLPHFGFQHLCSLASSGPYTLDLSTNHCPSIISWLQRLQRWEVGGPGWQNFCHLLLRFFSCQINPGLHSAVLKIILSYMCVAMSKRSKCNSSTQEQVYIFIEIMKNRH